MHTCRTIDCTTGFPADVSDPAEVQQYTGTFANTTVWPALEGRPCRDWEWTCSLGACSFAAVESRGVCSCSRRPAACWAVHAEGSTGLRAWQRWPGTSPMGVFMPARRWAMFSCACLSSSGSLLLTACVHGNERWQTPSPSGDLVLPVPPFRRSTRNPAYPSSRCQPRPSVRSPDKKGLTR